MLKVSYSEVFGIRYERESDQAINAGDVVCTGPNQRPQFSVLAVAGDKAWVRNVDNGADGIVELNRCRKVEIEAHRPRSGASSAS
jgi:hypothetical protein